MNVSDFGEFFQLQRRDTDPGWHSLRDLTRGPAMSEHLINVAKSLNGSSIANIEPRVVVSTFSLGLFARLVSPTVGAAVLDTKIPALDFDTTFFKRALAGPLLLATTDAETTPDLEKTLSDVLFPLAHHIGETYSVSSHVLRGNVASAVFGALRVITLVEPTLSDGVFTLGLALLGGPLSGLGEITESPQGRQFVRASCCLFYRIPNAGYCGDCVLVAR